MNDSGNAAADANLLTINNQNELEDEALQEEDRRQREEEIRNLLTHAMDEFNFPDQDTVNSSMASNNYDNHILSDEAQAVFSNQYLEAHADEQLKTLYEVRVREVAALNDKLARIQVENKQKEDFLNKKIIFLEMDLNQKAMSLSESQKLLVEKTEELKHLHEQLEDAESFIQTSEVNLAKLNDENIFLKDSNMKLERQIALMENGCPIMGGKSDQEFQEAQRQRIAQLENALGELTQQQEHKDRQCQQALTQCKQQMQDYAELLNRKNEEIAEISKELLGAQRQLNEMTLKETQSAPVFAESLSAEAVRKLCKQQEEKESEVERLNKELESQIVTLKAEKQKLEQDLSEKERAFANQQKIASDLQASKNSFEKRLNEIINKYLKIYHTWMKTVEKRTSLMRSYDNLVDMYKNLQVEHENLKKKLGEIERIRGSREENAAQTSLLNLTSSAEIANLEKEKEDLYRELLSAQDAIKSLDSKVHSVLKDNLQLNSQLKVKVGLEEEREGLIKELQRKAAQFEEALYERRKEIETPETASVGVNTDTFEEINNLMKIKYDSMMYNAEAVLRRELKKEFDEKLERFLKSRADSESCGQCKKVQDEKQLLSQARDEDREAVAAFVDHWKDRFRELEEVSRYDINQLRKLYDEQLVAQTVNMQQQYARQCENIVQTFKQQATAWESNNAQIHFNNAIHWQQLGKKISGILQNISTGNDKIEKMLQGGITNKTVANEFL